MIATRGFEARASGSGLGYFGDIRADPANSVSGLEELE
jgi:hypothetical protein